jgi:hypothetical protein
MSSNIAIIPQFNLSADLAAEFAAFTGADDLDQGISGGFPVMSIRGAKWRVVQGGEEHPVYMPGTKDLSPFVKVVIMKANGNLSKTYYEGQFVEGSDAKPDCSSNDGSTPSPDSPKPQSKTCATCPKNEWGSKISPGGAKIKACADVRRLAILPADDMEYDPILLRIPGASLGDLAAYGKALKARGIPYSAVVTKLSFDADAAFPKVMFAFERVLTPEEMRHVLGRLNEPIVSDVLGLSGSRSAPLLAAPAADDKFGIPADVQNQVAASATAAANAGAADELEAAVGKVEEAAKPAPKPRAKKTEPAPEPVAVNTAPAGGNDILSDLDDALAGLGM